MTALAVQAAEPVRDSARENPVVRPLDLKLAPLSRLFTPRQIDTVLARTHPELENVEVQATRLNDVPFRDNSASTAETAFTSVVRWLTPSSLYASNVNYTPDATDPYRPTSMLASSYHPSFAPPYSQH